MGYQAHALVTEAGGRHGVIAQIFADATARLAAVGFGDEGSFVAGDVGKLAFDADTGHAYILVATAPTWVLFSEDDVFTETSGPTGLTLGDIADGEYLIRSGTTIIGSAPAGGAWGGYYAYIEDDTTRTQSSAVQSLDIIESITTPVLTPGTYRITWALEAKNAMTNFRHSVRVRADGHTLSETLSGFRDATNWIVISDGFGDVEVDTARAITAVLELSSGSTSTTISYRRTRLSVMRLT